METIHPTPWSIKSTPYGTHYVADAKGNAVCSSGWRNDLGLIAAAPTMAEAMADAVEHCELRRSESHDSWRRCARCKTFVQILTEAGAA